MKNKIKILSILIGVLALVEVFLVVDFNFSRSETAVEHHLTAIR